MDPLTFTGLSGDPDLDEFWSFPFGYAYVIDTSKFEYEIRLDILICVINKHFLYLMTDIISILSR